jgi:preprotein translocase subunit SecB
MVLSHLILKNYFITNLSIKANPPPQNSPEEAIKAIAEGGTGMTSKVEVAKNSENNRDWRVSLQLSCRPVEGKFCLYYIELELLGFFEVHPKYEEKKVEELVLRNAPSLLLGAARELVLLITSRGPIAPFTLPSASFTDLRPVEVKKVTTRSSKVA